LTGLTIGISCFYVIFSHPPPSIIGCLSGGFLPLPVSPFEKGGIKGDLFYINLITRCPLGEGKGGGVLTEISMVLAFMYNDSLSRIPFVKTPFLF